MKLFPQLNFTKPASKPNTMKRFDSVFTALNLLVQLAGWSFALTLSSLLQLLYNRIVSSSFSDAQATAVSLKFYRMYYLAIVRGGRAFADLTHPTGGPFDIESYSGEGKPEDRIINRIVSYREELVSSDLPSLDLAYFDRIVFAILSFDRIMTYPVSPNFSTITDKSDFKYDLDGGFFKDLPTLLSRLGITPKTFWKEVRSRAKAQKHVIMSSGGVNGPASWTAHTDAKAILADTGLYTQFRNMSTMLGMQWLLQDLVSCVSLPGHDSTRDDMIHTGRLHHFEEWGGKCRVVAIVDYWTQVLMSPLHDAIFHFLSQIPSDGTFDQDAACERVREMTSRSGNEVYSFDLTAATDRLPLEIQMEILTFLTTRQFAGAWGALLVDRDYYHVDTNKNYRYMTGQPMGSKSSWAMLALTHHVIVQAAAHNTSTVEYQDYALLGDDITLTGTAVATEYRRLMDLLCVTINMAKSVVHHSDVLSAAEFCKRVYVSGVELTTIPVKLTAKTIMNGRLAPQLQNEMSRRGVTSAPLWLAKWIFALVDTESAQFLAILNTIPRSISSLVSPITMGGKFQSMSKWFGDDHNISSNDMRQAFLFVAITEQLKRLDNLLRQAQIIHAAIEDNAFGYSTLNASVFLGSRFAHPQHDLKALGASMPQLSPTHPIVRAAQVEMDRIGALLADLRSGDTRVTSRAERRLLDMFRSSLSDQWSDPDAARGQADRSLVQRALNLLADICLNRTSTEGGARAHYVDFTVNLAYVNRLWTVSWLLGENVKINAVRSRVLSTVSDAETLYSNIITETSVIDRFHTPRTQKGSKKSLRPNRSPVARVAAATKTE